VLLRTGTPAIRHPRGHLGWPSPDRPIALIGLSRWRESITRSGILQPTGVSCPQGSQRLQRGWLGSGQGRRSRWQGRARAQCQCPCRVCAPQPADYPIGQPPRLPQPTRPRLFSHTPKAIPATAPTAPIAATAIIGDGGCVRSPALVGRASMGSKSGDSGEAAERESREAEKHRPNDGSVQ
jgi:hypothetical protein